MAAQESIARSFQQDAIRATPLMPEFDARRTATRLRNLKFIAMQHSATIPVETAVPVPYNTAAGRVMYRNGLASAGQANGDEWYPDEVVTIGVEGWDGFRGVLNEIAKHLAELRPQWVRWEPGPQGRLAVLRFTVPKENANFGLKATKLRMGGPAFSAWPSYTFEAAVDPATGAVFRYVVLCDLEHTAALSRLDVAVEFQPLSIAGRTFVVPFRSITAQTILVSPSYQFAGASGPSEIWTGSEKMQLYYLTDITFSDYRPAGQAAQAHRAAAGGPPADPQKSLAALEAADERVDPDQLQKLIAGLPAKNDRDAARRLAHVQLTQRLSAQQYSRLRDQLPGKLAGEALLAIYDASEFLPPPPADVLPDPAPDAQGQARMIAGAGAFVSSTMRKMPDLFATRQLMRLEDLRVVRGTQPSLPESRPFAVKDRSNATVKFRQGMEVLEVTHKPGEFKVPTGLETRGTFGPILDVVMGDLLQTNKGSALQASIAWDHWEAGPAGRVAVFRFVVPEAASHFTVQFCCYMATAGFSAGFGAAPGYHGELLIDAKTNAVVRVVLRSDMKPDPMIHIEPEGDRPVLRSDVMVEYGPVEIGGKTYICPVRAVTLMTTFTLGPEGPLHDSFSPGVLAGKARKALARQEYARVNAINDAAFTNYHVFRTEMRIVNSSDAAPASK